MAKTKTDIIFKAPVARLSVGYLQTPLLRVKLQMEDEVPSCDGGRRVETENQLSLLHHESPALFEYQKEVPVITPGKRYD